MFLTVMDVEAFLCRLATELATVERVPRIRTINREPLTGIMFVVSLSPKFSTKALALTQSASWK